MIDYGAEHPDPDLPDPDGPVDGAQLLKELHATITRYVALPSEQAADAMVLWVAATHAQTAWEHAARLVLTSPEKRCGKSRTQDIIAGTCHRPLITVNATIAAVVRSLGDDPPTLIVDEADTIFGTKKQAENNEDLRGILNAGHQRDRPMIRWDMTARRLEELPTFAMVCLASIGDLPDTIMDRAVVVRMRRKAPGEKVAPFRTRRDGPALNELRQRLGEWAAAVTAQLKAAVPDTPLEDRAADTWEPLLAVADAAGGDWPARARAAAVTLAGEQDQADAEVSHKIRLLGDIRDLFTEFTVSFLPSQELVNRLRAVEDAPWSDLTATMLAERLRDYGIKPGRNSAGTARGYQAEKFLDAFSRYLPPLTPRQKVSDPSDTLSDLQEPSDGQSASDTPTRQTVRPVSALTCGSDDLTGSDAPPAPSGARCVCGALWPVASNGERIHYCPSCGRDEGSER